MVEKLKKEEINKIVNFLKDNYDIDKDVLKKLYFYLGAKERIYVSMLKLDKFFNIKNSKVINLGIYLGKFQKDKFRLSIEGCNLLKPQDRVLNLKDDALSSFLYGESLEVKDFEEEPKENILYVVKNKDNYLGCVLYSGNFLMNFISKGRKVQFNKVF